MMRKVILLLAIFLFAQQAWAQSVSISPDHKRIRIGEEIKLTLQSKSSSDKQVKWPVIKDTLGEHFTILSVDKLDTLSSEGASEFVLEQKVSITSFDSGSHKLPQLPFEFISGSDTDFVQTDALSFSVLTVPVDTTLAIKDIHNIVDVPFEIGEYIPWIIGALVLVAILVGGIYWYLQKKKPEQPKVQKTLVIPWKQALEDLDRIEKESVWKTGKLKLYYSDVSETLRTYFENQFEVPALESTTHEILGQLKNRAWSEQTLEEIKEILLLSDLVKFAKENPAEASQIRTLQLARKVVEDTRPKEMLVNEGKEEDHA
jgi:hypothetical protein